MEEKKENLLVKIFNNNISIKEFYSTLKNRKIINKVFLVNTVLSYLFVLFMIDYFFKEMNTISDFISVFIINFITQFILEKAKSLIKIRNFNKFLNINEINNLLKENKKLNKEDFTKYLLKDLPLDYFIDNLKKILDEFRKIEILNPFILRQLAEKIDNIDNKKIFQSSYFQKIMNIKFSNLIHNFFENEEIFKKNMDIVDFLNYRNKIIEENIKDYINAKDFKYMKNVFDVINKSKIQIDSKSYNLIKEIIENNPQNNINMNIDDLYIKVF